MAALKPDKYERQRRVENNRAGETDPKLLYDLENIPEVIKSIQIGDIEMAKKQKHLSDIQRVIT